MNNQTYNRILKASRKKELELTRSKINDVISLLTEIDDSLQSEIARFSDDYGILRKEQLKAMKDKIEHDLELFKEQYAIVVDSGIQDTTRLILDRNGNILLEVEGTRKIIDSLEDDIVKQVLQYKEKDGLILSDRIWRITEEAKTDIANRISQGMLLGESHVKVAKDLRQYIIKGGLRYKTERLAMTEMAKAYKHANEISVEAMRQNSEYMWFEKWELSPSHPKPDVCDILASQNTIGEGPGVYKTAPNRHPGCYCYIYPVYRPKRGTATYPTVGKEPDTSDIDKSQYKLAKELT